MKPQDYLWECLRSLKNQTLTANKFDVLIIVNGEKEPYYDMIKKFIEQENMNNFFIHYTSEKGVSNARNFGIALADNPFLCFLDDDDYLSHNYLEEMLKSSENGSIVVSNFRSFRIIQGKFEPMIGYIERAYHSYYNTERSIFSQRKFMSSIGGKLISRDCIKKIKFNNKFSKGEDSLFLAEISKNINRIIFSNSEAIYYRRIRSDSANNSRELIGYRIQRKYQLINEYRKLLFKKGYHKLFVLSRIIAQIKNMIK